MFLSPDIIYRNIFRPVFFDTLAIRRYRIADAQGSGTERAPRSIITAVRPNMTQNTSRH